MARTIARGRTDEERLGIYTYFMRDKTNVNPTPDTVTNIVIKIKKAGGWYKKVRYEPR